MHTQRQFNIWFVLLAGITTGLGLGVLFKIVEKLTSIKVYTLLLNIDYFPGMKDVVVPELIGFLLHMIVSISFAFCVALYLFYRKKSVNKIMKFSIISSIIIGVALFPTTALSEVTPPLTDLAALTIWLLGHTGYGWLLGRILLKALTPPVTTN